MDNQKNENGSPGRTPNNGPAGSAPGDSSVSGALRREINAHLQRFPFSFYMLLAIPLVMLLAVPIFLRWDDNPLRLAGVLTLLFVFLGVVLLRAVMDIFEIGRKNLTEKRDTFRTTLAEDAFLHRLGESVKEKDKKRS